MNAIAILKEMIGDYELLGLTAGINNKKKMYDADVKRINALKEALLALEQKEKLSKWLDDVEQNIKPTFEGTLEKTLYGKLVGTCKVREIMGLEK